MPKFLIIGSDFRLQLLDDLAAIAETDLTELDNVRFFEATWQTQTLRIETLVTRDQALIQAKSTEADFLLLVISENDGITPTDTAEISITIDRLELAGVCLTNTQTDEELRKLVQLEITEVIRRNRPRWDEVYLIENCNIFFHILKKSFFTDCL